VPVGEDIERRRPTGLAVAAEPDGAVLMLLRVSWIAKIGVRNSRS
jgi:hypothetical protein